MSRLGINTGSNPNDGQGDPLRVAMGKINSNFTEIYNIIGDGNNLTSYASTAGISTLARNLTGSPRINVSGVLNTGITTTEHLEVRNITSTGVVTATQFVGDGSQLTNVTALVGGLEVLDDNVRKGVARELNFGPNIVSTGPDGVGRVTISVASSVLVVGVVTTALYAETAGTSNSSNYAQYAATAGVSTSATYASTAGISTVAQGLTGTPNLNVGIVTASRFVGDGSLLTNLPGGVGGNSGYANTAGIATVAQGLTGTPDITVNDLEVTGVTTFYNSVHFDYDKLLLIGSNDELQIYHNGVNSYIDNFSGNNLVIRDNGAGIQLRRYGGGPSAGLMANFNTGGGVELYYDSVIKFQTFQSGVSINDSVGIGTTAGNPPYRLTVSGIGATITQGLANAIADFTSSVNGYGQLNVRNSLSGTNASGDIVVTANTGNDNSNFIDLGINNTGFTTTSWTINGALDGYLYTSDGNLSIGAASSTKYLSLFVGGTLSSNEQVRVTTTGVGIGTTNVTSKLTVGGDVRVSGVVTASRIGLTSFSSITSSEFGDLDINVLSYDPEITSTWTFNRSGNLDVPLAINFDFLNTGSVGVIAGQPDHIVIAAGVGKSIKIASNDGASVWAFDTDGRIVFPDNTVQTTAYTGVSGIASYATSAGIATYASTSGIATYATSAGIVTYASTAGISTVAQGLTGTPNLNVGIVTATSYIGSGSSLTGLTGASANTYGNSTTVPQIVVDANGRISSITNILISGGGGGGGSSIIVNDDGSLVGSAGTIDFGIGISVTPAAAGVVTANVTYSPVAGYSTSSGVSTSATTAGYATIAGYSTSSGVSTTSGYATIAGYSTSSGVSTSAATAGYASTAGISTVAQGLTGTPNLNVGVVTATSFFGNGSGLTGVVTSIVGLASEGYVNTQVGLATAGLLSSTGNGSSLTGIVTYITAGSGISIDQNTGNVTITATGGGGGGGGIVGLTVQDEGGTVGTAGSTITLNFVGQNVTATASGTISTITLATQTYVDTAGIATYATIAGYSTSSGIATYATSSGIATNAGISTSVIGGVGIITQLSVSAITTTTNLNVTGIGTFLTAGLKVRNPANTFQYNITSGAITADRTLNLPVITATDTLAVLGLSQTFTAVQAFSNTLTASATLDLTGNTTGTHLFGSNQTTGTLTFGGTSGTGTITFGRATTSQQTDIQAGVTASGNTKTINLGTGGASGSFTRISVGPTSGVGTVIINSGANLGIGSTLPTSNIDVVGSGKFTGIVTASRFDSVTAGTPVIESTDTISINTPRVAISTDLTVGGNTGIGTTIATSRLTVSGDVLVTGVVTATSFSGNASSATYATNAGVSTYATISGYSTSSGVSTTSTYATIAGYSTSSGVSTSVIGGIASVSQLSVSGISTLGVTTTTNLTAQQLNVSGVVTSSQFSGSGTNLTGIVTSIVAGTNITISGSTGEVTINSTVTGGATAASIDLLEVMLFS